MSIASDLTIYFLYTGHPRRGEAMQALADNTAVLRHDLPIVSVDHDFITAIAAGCRTRLFVVVRDNWALDAIAIDKLYRAMQEHPDDPPVEPIYAGASFALMGPDGPVQQTMIYHTERTRAGNSTIKEFGTRIGRILA